MSTSNDQARERAIIKGVFSVIVAFIGVLGLVIVQFMQSSREERSFQRTMTVAAVSGVPQSPLETQKPPSADKPGNALTTHPPLQPTAIAGRSITTCPNFQPGETRSVPVRTIVIGDVMVDDVKQYDDGEGEGTIVYLEKETKIGAQWGAGCLMGGSENLQTLIDRELTSGCGNVGCQTIRLVIVQQDGNQKVSFTSK